MQLQAIFSKVLNFRKGDDEGAGGCDNLTLVISSISHL